MEVQPTCPACGGDAWQPIGESKFERDPGPATEYLRQRYRVLFELWAPGDAVFVAHFVLCAGCGFVGYTPRATEAEIDAKYRMLSDMTRQASSPGDERARPTRLDQRRSGELYEALRPHLPVGGGKLLDFGGGNGALMNRFVAAGFDCSVVDYTEVTVPGVTRLGDTLDDLPADAQFDVVFCSHVFEHVASPVDIATRLGRLLKSSGLLFVEVPLEILGGPPKMRDPVTHVNFFCESSLAMVLRRAGLGLDSCRTTACLFASGAYRYGVRAIAHRCAAAEETSPPGSRGARRLLGAGLWVRASMAVANPRILLSPLSA